MASAGLRRGNAAAGRWRSLLGGAAYTTTTTSQSPAAIAAAACSTCTSKLDPPVLVESVKRGWIPRYSASCIDDVAWHTPSTSSSVSPASASASRTTAASSAWPWRSSSPVGDTASATPTSAAAPRRERSTRAGATASRCSGMDEPPPVEHDSAVLGDGAEADLGVGEVPQLGRERLARHDGVGEPAGHRAE